MDSIDVDSILNVVNTLSKKLEDVQKLEFIQALELYYCTDSSVAMLEVVKQALKVKDCKIALQHSVEKSINFLINYLDGVSQIRTLLYDISGGKELRTLLKNDNRLEEKVVIYIKAVPIYLGGLEIVKKSEAYIKTIMKKATDFVNKKEGITKSPERKTEVTEPEDSGETYGDKELKFFINDLMNYLQVLKMQAEEKGVKRHSTIPDEMKKFELNSRKNKLIGYYGERVNDMKEGPGKYYYLNGDIYDGEWQFDKKHGRGTYTFASKGNRYEGMWKDDKIHGKGVYYYANGSKYQGDWVEDNREGFGVFIFEDGGQYDGEWKNDQMHGKGVICYKNGSKFTGEWKNGHIHGRGIFEFANGYQIEEEWKDGSKKKEHIRNLK